LKLSAIQTIHLDRPVAYTQSSVTEKLITFLVLVMLLRTEWCANLPLGRSTCSISVCSHFCIVSHRYFLLNHSRESASRRQDMNGCLTETRLHMRFIEVEDNSFFGCCTCTRLFPWSSTSTEYILIACANQLYSHAQHHSLQPCAEHRAFVAISWISLSPHSRQTTTFTVY